MTSSVLDRARAGSEQAFGELVEPHRRELHLHCYRMLGSVVDADDLLQETLLAAWRGLDGFAGRSSVRAWLYRIATNRCLNAIRDSRRRAPREPVPPFDPPPPSRRSDLTWLQPYPDALLELAAEQAPGPADRYVARETVELAFVAAVQRLPPGQTAVLLLCDVLGFTTAEVAGMLKISTTAVKGRLQRARAPVTQHGVAQQGDTRHRPDSTHERQLARHFARAFTDDDIEGVVALLTDDAWLAMPPAPHVYDGPGAIRAFLTASAAWRSGRPIQLAPSGANTQPAFGCHFADRFVGVLVLTMRGRRITGITRFLDPTLERHVP